jgi:recombination protein RecT
MQTNQKPIKNEVVEKKTNQIIQFEKNIADSVTNRVTQLTSEGRLNLPTGYSVGNALNSAYLIISDPKNNFLSTCTKESVANALLDMAIMGLSPQKKQGYFIKYGANLTWFTSYFGKSAVVKRLKGIDTEPIATLIYEGDELVLTHTSLGEEAVLEHKTTWENKAKGKIVGVYASLMQGDIKRSAVMTMAEVKEAWTKNPSPNNKRDHVDFAGEFAKRTVIGRLTKMIIQTSNDDDLLAETFIGNEDQHYVFDENVNEIEAVAEVENNANTGELIDVSEESEEQEIEVVQEEEQTEQQNLFDQERKTTTPNKRGF